jgi:hypothetical protein
MRLRNNSRLSEIAGLRNVKIHRILSQIKRMTRLFDRLHFNGTFNLLSSIPSMPNLKSSLPIFKSNLVLLQLHNISVRRASDLTKDLEVIMLPHPMQC